MRPVFRLCLALAVLATAGAPIAPAASPADAVRSVVSVLPVWPGHAQGGAGAEPGVAPEGSGVVLFEDGVIATAAHVVDPAERIDVRLEDGRILAARLLAQDLASDIALLKVDAPLSAIEVAPAPTLAQPVCAIGNALGLGLSVTCGVVSATDVSAAGFNPVEDFIQTDAAANPGASGGALVDAEGRLVGMMSAIFASNGDANIGVNFAVSSALLVRVGEALLAEGKVVYPAPGWRLQRAGRAELAQRAGAVVAEVAPGGPAAAAGIEPGDLILEIGARRIRKPRDAIAALAVIRPAETPVPVSLTRNGADFDVQLSFTNVAGQDATDGSPSAAARPLGDCPHPAPVCLARQAVFPVSSYDPIGSATRIGATLLVTNRHIVGDRSDAVVYTPEGPRGARVIASSYRGDLALLEVEGLPTNGMVLEFDDLDTETSAFYAVGADVARQEIRVFDRGELLLPPAEGAALGRWHVTARMQPGVSGGALLTPDGALVGIAAGGGEGRYEAIPLKDVRELLALRDDDAAALTQARLGAAFVRCAELLDDAEGAPLDPAAAETIAESCAAANNAGLLLRAGRVLAHARQVDSAIAMHGVAVAQTPNSINARISLLVSMQLGGRFEEMLPHARWLTDAAPDDPQALRFGVQSGVWGDDMELAEAAYALLLKADPRQAEAARRFIDAAPPRPPRR